LSQSFIRPSQINRIVIVYAVLLIITGLYFSFSGGGNYSYDSPQKLNDLVKIKIWLFASILMATMIYGSALKHETKLLGWLITLSFYFVVLYALLYKGTDYGLNGHWGDNGNRLALVTKFREFASPFQDWYFKNLPSFYPPLWFYLQGKLAWLFGVESYKTIKLGYFVIYALYPLTLYFVWGKLASKTAAFSIAFLTIFLRDIHLDYVYYEHITAALFIPWWLHFIEDIKSKEKKSMGWYALGGFLGALLFMTYYYWFFIGLLSIVLRYILKFILGNREFLKSSLLKEKILVLVWTAIFSAIYWLPLLISIIRYGSESMQSKWFHKGYLALNLPFFGFSAVDLVYLLGFIYLIVRFKKIHNSRYAILLLSMLVLLLIDRLINLTESSIQTRKILELLPVFLAISSGFGVALFYRVLKMKLPRLRPVFVILVVFFVFYHGNSHADQISESKYQKAMKLQVPVEDIAVFESVDYRGKVFLTDHYLEASYIPYYFFICHWGPSAHTASRYNQRISFLRYLGRFGNERQVAFLLRNNIFDTVDYFYLPQYENGGHVYYDTYPLYYPAATEKLRIEFPKRTTIDSRYFELLHNRGLYGIVQPDLPFSDIFDEPKKDVDLSGLIRQYNRFNLAADFLPDCYVDSIRRYADDAGEYLADSINIDLDIKFDKGIFMSEPAIIADKDGRNRLRLIFLASHRLRRDYAIFIHAYPKNKDILPDDRLKSGFINLDIYPERKMSGWIAGEYQLIETSLNLQAGEYKFHIGLFNKMEGRLSRTHKTDYINIGLSG